MARRVIWSPASENDMENILDYLETRWDQKVISRFLDKVEDCINLIVEDPLIFPLIHVDFKIRKSVVTKQNTIYYRDFDDRIEIIRVFDNRQDPKKLKF